jgi:phospholipid/cholesterol/gamma-HCH transport system permease protein
LASMTRAMRGPGEVAVMVAQVSKRMFKRPFQFAEFVEQAWFITSVTLMPTILVSVPFGAVISLQVGQLTSQLGAQSFAGATAVLATVREAAPIAAALIISGAAGSAICSDLGARKIREEIDALTVLGIDPIKSLVAPRFVALMALTSLLNVFALLFGTLGGLLVTVSNGAPIGGFLATFFTNATVPEVAASLLKTTIFGAIIAIVCCYKGLSAQGGAEGVGRAVNQAIVISFMAIGVVNYVFTQTLLATYPELSSVR